MNCHDKFSDRRGITLQSNSKLRYFCLSSVCVCLVIPFILDVRIVDVPAGATQEEGHTGFLIHLPSAVLALIFLARRIQPFLSLVDREVEFCVLTIQSSSTCWAFLFFYFFCEGKSQLVSVSPELR